MALLPITLLDIGSPQKLCKMKTALFFLAFIAVAAAQWTPWNPNDPCDDADDCPLADVYCCIYNQYLGYKKCELTPMEGWACWPETDCPCASADLTCAPNPNSSTGATCQISG
ncbi:uncharacterized protein LOC144878701 [Branchiostoma floridae x Branchiostoma japonicum]